MKQIDAKDSKILIELKKNSRISHTSLAKKLKISKEMLGYRVRRLEKRGIIKQYIPLIDISKLGLEVYGVFLRLSCPESEKAKLTDAIIKSNYVSWASTTTGDFDLALAIQAYDAYDFKSKYSALIDAYRDYISYESLNVRVQLQKESNELVTKKMAEHIDDVDIRILKMLSKNSNIALMDIYSAEGISPSTVLNRIRKLEKRKIIQGYSIIDNSEQPQFQCLIKTGRVSADEEKRLKSYCSLSKNIRFFVEIIGEWNFEITISVKDLTELQKVQDDIKNILGKSLISFRVLPTIEYYLKYTPVVFS